MSQFPSEAPSFSLRLSELWTRISNARFSRRSSAGLINCALRPLNRKWAASSPCFGPLEKHRQRFRAPENPDPWTNPGDLRFTLIVPSCHSEESKPMMLTALGECVAGNFAPENELLQGGEMGLKLSKTGLKGPEIVNMQFVQSQLVNVLWKNYIRNLVSKKRRRMLVAGYDLDMTYITDRLLAMSFPAQCMRAMYRNPLWQVKSVLETRHPGHYKVYNLCIEEGYDASQFNGCVERYPFDDNHVPPISMIKEFCEDVHAWLSSDPKNIAVVHCMAGKGRTGLMVSSYLVYTGMSAEKALQMYAEKRTTNNEGVSIPSQRRYVAYWEKLVSLGQGVNLTSPFVNLPQPCAKQLQHIRLYDTVSINQIFVVVSELQEIPGQRYRPPTEVSKICCRQIGKDYERCIKPRYYYSFVESEEGTEDVEEEPRLIVQMDTESAIIYQKTCLGHHFEKPVHLRGDVCIIFYEKLIGGRFFYVCFNTAFITGSLLQFSIRDLDKLGQKGRSVCGPSFCLELFFGPSITR